MAIGMTYNQYWRDDPTMVKMYRRAYDLKLEQIKWFIYEGGMYTYEALCKVSPVLHAFCKNGTKPLPFSEKPYGIEKLNSKQEDKSIEKEKIENERLRAQIFFNNWYKNTKKHFEKKAGEK